MDLSLKNLILEVTQSCAIVLCLEATFLHTNEPSLIRYALKVVSGFIPIRCLLSDLKGNVYIVMKVIFCN